MSIPSISVTDNGPQMHDPRCHRLVRIDSCSTNASSSNNWGHHGYTLDQFLGKAGKRFEIVVGSTLLGMGFGPNAPPFIQYEMDFMESRGDWDSIPGISVTDSGPQVYDPRCHRLVRVDTNATSSTNWGRHGYTLDQFLGKAGKGFQNVLGNTLHKMGFGPNAALIRFEKRFMELLETWDGYEWSNERDERYKDLHDDRRRLVQYVRG